MSSVMKTLIFKELRERRTSLIVYSLVGIGCVWLYVSIFPSLQGQAKELSKAYASMPKEVLKAFGAEGTGLDTVESLLATKQFGLVWPILAIVIMLNRSANYIAGEIENGTLGTLLTQPLSRSKIYLAKYLSGVYTLLIFVACSVLVNIPIISLYKLEFSVGYELLFAAICTLFGLAILGAGMFVSALSAERSKVYGLIGGGIMIMFILNLLSGLKPALENLKYGSIFYYYNANDMIVNHHINHVSAVLFAVIAVFGFLAGLIAFNRRDIRI